MLLRQQRIRSYNLLCSHHLSGKWKTSSSKIAPHHHHTHTHIILNRILHETTPLPPRSPSSFRGLSVTRWGTCTTRCCCSARTEMQVLRCSCLSASIETWKKSRPSMRNSRSPLAGWQRTCYDNRIYRSYGLISEPIMFFFSSLCG